MAIEIMNIAERGAKIRMGKDVIIISRYFDPVHNGLGDHTTVTAQYLANQGWKVTVLCQVEDSRSSVSGNGMNLKIREFARDRDLYKVTVQTIKEMKPDMVLFQYVPHMWGRGGFALRIACMPLYLKLRFKTRIVTFLHELAYDWSKSPKRNLLALVHRVQLVLLAAGSTQFIVTNYHREQWVTKWLRPRMLVRIPAGNVSGRKPNKLRKTILDFPYICWYGTISQDQCLELLVRAFNKLRLEYPKTKLVLLGGFSLDRKQYETVLQTVSCCGERDSIYVRGFVEDSELSDILSGSLVNVFVSRSGPSGRRGVMAAYIRAGKPIIAIDGPETDPEFRHKENIVLVKASANSLLNALDQVITDRDYNVRLSNGCYQLYTDYYNDQTVYGRLEQSLIAIQKCG